MSTPAYQPLGIIADDLTGALDTAAPFASAGIEATTYLETPIQPQPAITSPVQAINTDTRYATTQIATSRPRAASRLFQGRRIYKKIDSTLRGHVVAETVAAMEAVQARFALVAPAFPQMGRTVRDGLVYVHGRLLESVQEGNDPFGHGIVSSVVDLYRRQSRLSVALVPLAAVRGGDSKLEQAVRNQVDDGIQVIVFDAETPEDMAMIAGVAQDSFPDGLAVGSGGLATAMAARHRNRTGAGPVAAPGYAAQRVLVISASLNRATASQFARLKEVHADAMMLGVDAEAVFGGYAERQRETERLAEAMRHHAESRIICVAWRQTDGRPPSVPLGSQEEVLAARSKVQSFLTTLATEQIAGAGFDAFVIAGGDTAYSILSGLNALTIGIDGEVQPGVPIGRIGGGYADGLPIVTKSGGFSDADALVRAVEQLCGRRFSASFSAPG